MNTLKYNIEQTRTSDTIEWNSNCTYLPIYLFQIFKISKSCIPKNVRHIEKMVNEYSGLHLHFICFGILLGPQQWIYIYSYKTLQAFYFYFSRNKSLNIEKMSNSKQFNKDLIRIEYHNTVPSEFSRSILSNINPNSPTHLYGLCMAY